MNAPWYYLEDGERCGPISTVDLKQRVAEGKLLESSLIWREGFDGWITAGRVPGLCEVDSVSIQDDATVVLMRSPKSTPFSPEELVVPSGRAEVRGAHVALWSSVAVVAIGCGFLVWHHEHDKAFRLQVTALNRAVQTAVDDGNGSAIEDAYTKLLQAIANRPISSRALEAEVKQTLMHVVPIIDQIKQYRSECQEYDLAEARKRAEYEAEESRRRLAYEAMMRPKERYYSDGGGSLISESEGDRKLSEFRAKISAMPDNGERAYMGGVLKALENEWEQIKSQGSR